MVLWREGDHDFLNLKMSEACVFTVRLFLLGQLVRQSAGHGLCVAAVRAQNSARFCLCSIQLLKFRIAVSMDFSLLKPAYKALRVLIFKAFSKSR